MKKINYNYIFISILLIIDFFINYYLITKLFTIFNIPLNYNISTIGFSFSIGTTLLLTIFTGYVVFRIFRYIKNSKETSIK